MSEKYLGETVVDVAKHPIFSKYTNVDWAMYFIESYGPIDGGHHKAWVLDQAARCLNNTQIIVKQATWDNGHSEYRIRTGKPSKEYKDWVKRMRGKYDKTEKSYEYDYDEGICP